MEEYNNYESEYNLSHTARQFIFFLSFRGSALSIRHPRELRLNPSLEVKVTEPSVQKLLFDLILGEHSMRA